MRRGRPPRPRTPPTDRHCPVLVTWPSVDAATPSPSNDRLPPPLTSVIVTRRASSSCAMPWASSSSAAPRHDALPAERSTSTVVRPRTGSPSTLSASIVPGSRAPVVQERLDRAGVLLHAHQVGHQPPRRNRRAAAGTPPSRPPPRLPWRDAPAPPTARASPPPPSPRLPGPGDIRAGASHAPRPPSPASSDAACATPRSPWPRVSYPDSRTCRSSGRAGVASRGRERGRGWEWVGRRGVRGARGFASPGAGTVMSVATRRAAADAAGKPRVQRQRRRALRAIHLDQLGHDTQSLNQTARADPEA